MISILVAVFAGLVAAMGPLVSLAAWAVLLYFISPYFREKIDINRERSQDGWELRDIAISMIVPIFVLSAIISGGLAILISLVVTFPFILLDLIMGTAGTITVMVGLISAGPVEESTKLLVSVLLFMLLSWLLPKLKEGGSRPGILDSIMVGLFVGASFGALESVLYLTSGLPPLLSEPLIYENVDPVLFRLILGVSIHSLFTGISSAGLGARQGRVRKTVSFFLIAATLHSMVNGIMGMILIVEKLDGLGWAMIINIIQMTILSVAVIVLWKLWKRDPTGPAS